MKTPIRLTHRHFRDLASHFLALSSGDRFLRFGWVMTDVEIVAYVESMFVSADSAFVVVEPDRDISGVLHLESMGCGVNLGLSVSGWARNEFWEKITLADDSLRSQWNGASASLLELPEPIFS